MKKFFVKLALFFFIGFCLFFAWGYYWGLIGKISMKRFDLILSSLPPWQKRELADALNYYYNKNFLARYTSGYILRCDPESESIKRQFNWFHRDTASTIFAAMPDYHQVVFASLKTQISGKKIPECFSTFQMELMLEKSGYGFMTGKDAIGLGISAFSLAMKILISAFNPFAGAAITVVGLGQASLSDPVKAIPAIVTFMKIRSRDFSCSFLLSWGFCVFLFYQPSLKRRRKEKSSAGKRKVKKTFIQKEK